MKQKPLVSKVDFPKPTPHTCHNKGHVVLSRVSSCSTSSSIDPTPRTLMDLMTSLHLRLDDHDTHFQEIQGQVTYIISWIHSQGASSSALPLSPLNAQTIVFFFFWSRFFFLTYISLYPKLLLIYIYIYVSFIYRFTFLLCAYCLSYFVIFVRKRGRHIT